MARSNKYSYLQKTPVYYNDFTNNFTVNPDTGNLYVVTNEECVKQSIRNLVLTNIFERFYQPLVGSKVQSLLFELNTPQTQNLLITTITDTITNFEPRAINPSASIYSIEDDNSITITVTFSLMNVPQPITFPLVLQRVR